MYLDVELQVFKDWAMYKFDIPDVFSSLCRRDVSPTS